MKHFNTKQYFYFISVFIAYVLLATGCATSTRGEPAPVVDTSELPSSISRTSNTESAEADTDVASATNKIATSSTNHNDSTFSANQYRVVKGDTLYSIGQKLGIPHQQIAQINNIENNLISVDQLLNLPSTGNGAAVNHSGSSLSVKQYRVVKGDTLYSIGQKLGIPHQQIANINNIENNNISVDQLLNLPSTSNSISDNDSDNVGKVITLPVRNDPSVSTTANSITKSTNSVTPTKKVSHSNNIADQSIEWRWPAKGKITAEYDKRKNKGIDIQGDNGQPILAASSGKVIYSGVDIRGYGKLVIIKHNRNYLSVYAHQGNTLVKEGQLVNSGYKISVMGKDSTATSKLHFEIRKKGKTVNPKDYLPSDAA